MSVLPSSYDQPHSLQILTRLPPASEEIKSQNVRLEKTFRGKNDSPDCGLMFENQIVMVFLALQYFKPGQKSTYVCLDVLKKAGGDQTCFV